MPIRKHHHIDLLLSMNDINIDVACEARFALERSCVPLACARRSEEQLSVMRRELHRQTSPDLSDEEWCASDVAFHRSFVDCAQNPVLSYQLTGAVEAMQPLMNMITFTARSRAKIISHHAALITSLKRRIFHWPNALWASWPSIPCNWRPRFWRIVIKIIDDRP